MYPTPESTMDDAARHAASVQRRREEALKDFAPRAVSLLHAHGFTPCSPDLKDLLVRCRELRESTDEHSVALLALLRTELERSLTEQGLRSVKRSMEDIGLWKADRA